VTGAIGVEVDLLAGAVVTEPRLSAAGIGPRSDRAQRPGAARLASCRWAKFWVRLGRPGEPVRVNCLNDVAEAWVKIGGNTA
jgi:hypothetical protein